MSKAWIEIIEASYRIELPEAAWLTGVLSAARPELDHGLGIWGMTYDLHELEGVGLRVPAAVGLPEGGSLESILQAQAAVPQKVIRETFQQTTCGTASQLLGKTFGSDTSIDNFQDAGVGDTLGINIRDPTPSGCLLVGILPKVSTLPASSTALWKKITAHVASGFRLQRQRAARPTADPTAGAAAILTLRGKVEHAAAEAQGAEALEQLREAVVAIESARGKLRRSDPEEAVDKWKGLVASRWSLLEHIEVGGRRYMLARENAPIDTGPSSLTSRERQILSYGMLGHSNKLVAYELGIAASTVRVLLGRAAAKLGTSTRDETIRAFAAMSRAHGLT